MRFIEAIPTLASVTPPVPPTMMMSAGMFMNDSRTRAIHHGAQHQGAEGDPDPNGCCGFHRPRSSAATRNPSVSLASAGRQMAAGPMFGLEKRLEAR